jgi:hypothetical protein
VGVAGGTGRRSKDMSAEDYFYDWGMPEDFDDSDPLIEGDICPICDKGVMTTRKNAETMEYFLGCSKFPFCKFTADICDDEY